MKSIIRTLNKRKHIVFLDLEGTQFSHEMIALGAVKVDLNNKYQIKKIHPGLKFYVKATGSIGRFVQELTGITPTILNREGIPFAKAIEKLRQYCGRSFLKMAFITFGVHDLRILAKSLEAHPNADKSIVSYIIKNDIDLSMIISQYIKDEHGNPYSLLNYLKLFNVEPSGVSHDPLNDAKDLLLLYDAIFKSPDIVYREYLKVLQNIKHFPEPISVAINKLVNGNDVSSEEFLENIRNYLQ